MKYTGHFDRCVEKAIEHLGTSPSEWLYIRKLSGSTYYELTDHGSHTPGQVRWIREGVWEDGKEGLDEALDTLAEGKVGYRKPVAIRVRKSASGSFHVGVVYGTT